MRIAPTFRDQDDGDPADGGSPKGAGLALTAASAPDECLSVASYRFLHHTAVSFVPSDIRVFTQGHPAEDWAEWWRG